MDVESARTRIKEASVAWPPQRPEAANAEEVLLNAFCAFNQFAANHSDFKVLLRDHVKEGQNLLLELTQNVYYPAEGNPRNAIIAVYHLPVYDLAASIIATPLEHPFPDAQLGRILAKATMPPRWVESDDDDFLAWINANIILVLMETPPATTLRSRFQQLIPAFEDKKSAANEGQGRPTESARGSVSGVPEADAHSPVKSNIELMDAMADWQDSWLRPIENHFEEPEREVIKDGLEP